MDAGLVRHEVDVAFGLAREGFDDTSSDRKIQKVINLIELDGRRIEPSFRLKTDMIDEI